MHLLSKNSMKNFRNLTIYLITLKCFAVAWSVLQFISVLLYVNSTPVLCKTNLKTFCENMQAENQMNCKSRKNSFTLFDQHSLNKKANNWHLQGNNAFLICFFFKSIIYWFFSFYFYSRSFSLVCVCVCMSVALRACVSQYLCELYNYWYIIIFSNLYRMKKNMLLIFWSQYDTSGIWLRARIINGFCLFHIFFS